MAGTREDQMVAIVTGAASGIGRSVTEMLLARGATVIGADVSPFSGVGVGSPGRFVGRRVDVTVEEDLRAATGAALEEFGRLDAAFNVAGVSRGAPLMDLDEDVWDFTVDRVLKGVFLSIKHEARAMRETGGAIVNVSSINSRVPMYTGAAYASGKAGVEMLTRSAALELAPYGIRVNAVQPGLIDTPLTQRRITDHALMEDWRRRIPLDRPGKPAEVASACLFLAGESASYITGASLIVDGGWDLTSYPDLRSAASSTDRAKALD